jgi:plasmid replication initiation protein
MQYKLLKVFSDYENPTAEQQRYSVVVKSNALIQQSRFSLSTQQQKIVLYIISQIEPFDEELKLYEFKITDFCAVCGIEPKGDIYTLLKAQIKAIADKSVWIKTDDGKDTIARWIEKPYIDERSGTIQIKLDEEMKPYLLQLKEKFTEYELIYTLNFKSKYSIRLYEYLKSIHYDKLKVYSKKVSIDEFQKLLDSNYTNFKDFHTRVLKKAHKEINEFSDMNFSYELLKQGRKITDVLITIETKEIYDRVSTTAKGERKLEEKRGKKQ